MSKAKQALLVIFSIGLTLVTPAIASAETPSVSRFPSITIEFGSTTKYTLTPPKSNSDGLWSYTSSNPKVAAISGDSIVPVGVGSSTITATQAATSNFTSATMIATLTITPGKPNVGAFADITTVFTPPTTPGKYSKIRLTNPYSNSPGVWTFTSLNPAVATISGADLSIIGIGEAPIVATQASTTNFLASSPVQMTFSATGPAPALSPWAPFRITLKDSPFQLTPPNSPSDGTWSFQLAKTDAATISGNILTLLKAGTITVSATQSKSRNSLYGATGASVKITIAKNPPTVGTLAPLVAYLGEPSVEVTDPTSDSPGAWSYSTSDPKIAKIKNGVIVPVAQGVVTVTAIQSATEVFESSAPVQATLAIGAALQIPTAGEFENLITYVQPTPLKLTAPQSTSKGKWSYKSANQAVLSSVDGSLIPVGPGLVLVTASQARTGTFGRIEKTFQVKVGDPFTVSANGGKNLINVKSSVPGSRVIIDDKPGKIGQNKIAAGSHVVKVYVNGLLGFTSRVAVTGLKKIK